MSQLLMRRPNLLDLPDLPPPLHTLPSLSHPVVLRERTEADDRGLAAVLRAAFPNDEWTPQSVRERLVDDLSVKRVVVLEYEERIVATASARLLPNAYPGSGYVHWVGADPELKGHKLGRIVTLATLHEFVHLGCRDAVLETDDFRLPAIVTYLRLGFEPVFRDETHRERWQKIEAALSAGA